MEIPCLSDEKTSREEIGLYFLNENLWELFTSGTPTGSSYLLEAEDQYPPGADMTSQAMKIEPYKINNHY